MTSHLNPLTGAQSIIRGNGSRYLVFFGFNADGEFTPSRAQPSRYYKTFAGAERAARRWVR